MNQVIYLGARDWLGSNWEAGLYPADLPEDWRLAYFSSQFNCVWLEAEQWRSVTGPEFMKWCEDVHSRFLFLLAADPGASLPAELAGRARLIGGDDVRLRWFDKDTDLAVLARELQAAGAPQEMFLLSRDGDLGQIERVRTLLELLGC